MPEGKLAQGSQRPAEGKMIEDMETGNQDLSGFLIIIVVTDKKNHPFMI